MRKLIARRKAEELNAKYGTEIIIEDREMFMQTANEMAEQPEPEPEPIKTNNDDE
jgi:hypothetical protein